MGGVGVEFFRQPGLDIPPMPSPALFTVLTSPLTSISAIQCQQEITALRMSRQCQHKLEQQEHMTAMAFAVHQHTLSLQQQQEDLLLKNIILNRAANTDI